MDCPPLLDDLVLGAADPDSVVARHLANCVRCQARLKLARPVASSQVADGIASAEPTARTAKIRPRATRVAEDSALEFGTICTIASDDAPGERLVVAVVAGGRPGNERPIVVVPISPNWEFAADWDLRVPPGDSPLGYPFILLAWAHGPVSRAQLDEKLASLPPATKSTLRDLWQAVVDGSGPPAKLEEMTGPPILDLADPRTDFQRSELERARVFYNASAAEVRDLAGPLLRLLRGGLGDESDPATIAKRADVEPKVVRQIFGSGFVKRFDADEETLGRLIFEAGLDTNPGSPTERAFREEASAWVENSRFGRERIAARQEGLIRRNIRRLFGNTRGIEDETEEFWTNVQASAARHAERRRERPEDPTPS